MFKKIFIQLCSQKGESPSYVCSQIGISAAAFSQWTDETIPRKVTQQRAAEYFGVSVDYLLGKEKSPTEEDEQMSEFAKLFPQLSDDEQRLVIAQMKGIIDMKEKK
jgi:transcriptional regulator with XRE-family HTH domain